MKYGSWVRDWDYWMQQRWSCPRCDEYAEPYEDTIYCEQCNEELSKDDTSV